MPAPGPSIEVTGNTLIAKGDLEQDIEERFSAALDELFKSEHTLLVVDLTNVPYMSSSFVRHLAKAMVSAKKAGRSVTVLTSKQVYRLLRLGGVDKVGHVELVGAE